MGFYIRFLTVLLIPFDIERDPIMILRGSYVFTQSPFFLLRN